MTYVPKPSPKLEALQVSIEEKARENKERAIKDQQNSIFNNMKKSCFPSKKKEPYVATAEDECIMQEYARGMYSGD